ncbi:MAG TPA: class D sortase [Candidatus Dormibacteraeota bacterium]|nr:class D sortase [Candidatus Dormibacteraeota bacterium]
MLGIWLGNLAAGEWWQVQALDRWSRLTGGLGTTQPVVPPPPRLMRPVGGIDFRLRVPRLHYAAVVREGVTPQVLFTGPGHYPGTAWPGQGGNVGIAAHNVYWLRFDELRPGDVIYLDTRYGTFRYRVTGSLVVPPDATWVLEDAPGRRLTLTTCSPLWAGQFAAGRLVVFATSDPGAKGEERGVSRPPAPVPPAGGRARPGGPPGPWAPVDGARPPTETAPGRSPVAGAPEAAVPPAAHHGGRGQERHHSQGAPPTSRPDPDHEGGRTPPGRVHRPPSPPPEREGRGRRAGVRAGSPSPATSRGASPDRR